MKIIVVGHPLVVRENRVAWRYLAHEHSDVQTILIPPEEWSDNHFGMNTTYKTQPEIDYNYEVFPLPLSNGHFARYIGLSDVVRQRKPDILCIAQERYAWSSLIALTTCRFLSPRARTISFNLTNIDYYLKWPHHILKEKIYFTFSHGIISSDNDTKSLLIKHGYKGRTTVQYTLGATEIPESSVSVNARSIPPFTIGYVGRLVSQKGVSDLVEAVAKLKGDWHLKFIGGGPERELLEEQVRRLNIAEQVSFLGFLSRQDVINQMQTLHVLALPSRTTSTWKEQFGVVLVEAMLSGTPVIGSSSGAIPEVIGDAGLIFPEGDVSALVACLQRLHDDSGLRCELAERGRQRALERYSATALAKQFYQFCVDLYNNR